MSAELNAKQIATSVDLFWNKNTNASFAFHHAEYHFYGMLTETSNRITQCETN